MAPPGRATSAHVPPIDRRGAQATEWERMDGWVSSKMCSTSSDAADIGSANERRMYAAFVTFGCNASLFDELEAKYEYALAG